MKYRYYDYNIFFSDFKSVIKQMGGYYSIFSSKIYKHWIDYFTPDIQIKIEQNLKQFILSKKYKIKSNWS